MSETNKKGYVIGIDLGTTNSCVAVMKDGKPIVLDNAEGANTTPSMVAFKTLDEAPMVGVTAKRQAVTNPANTIFGAKRFIGRTYEEVKKYAELMPYNVVKRDNSEAGIEILGKTYSPAEISAKILQKLVADAESKVGQKITRAVITVPAYFNDAQRQATKDAGRIAGLEVERIINEPTAAALAYGLDKKKNGTIAVYDLGGGTFDVSILEIADGVIEVKATNGDTFLGGEDFDNVLIDYVAEEFRKENGIDLRKDTLAKQRLKEACEKAKIELSSTADTEINIPFITADATGPKHLLVKMSRAKLESLTDDLIQRSLDPCKKALSDAGLSAKDINEVVLVGGMTRMPKVQSVVKEFFGKDPHKGVNPDEVVAIGAAIQAGVLQGDVNDILLLDVTPLSLGIETEGGILTRMIERNTTIPTKRTQVFSTAADNQTSVTIRIFQGEREMAADNKLLGQFDLVGLPAAPRGVPQIEVAFDIDANGIVLVSAKDMKTGKEQQITIKDGSGLSEEEIQRAIKEAELHAEDDKARKQKAEKRNQTEALIAGTEKALSEHGDKLEADEKSKVEEAVNNLKGALSADNEADIDKYIGELNTAAEKLAKLAYEASKSEAGSGAGAAGDAGAESDKPEDVTDV